MLQKNSTLPFILLLFFLSGISGLVYETVWLRILSRILGNTVYATSVVLAAFMAGLALGSYLLGRCTLKSRNLLRLYALLELGVGLAAFCLLFLFDALVPIYRSVYEFAGANRAALMFFQAGLLFVLLLIPTACMGGTLPILSAHTGQYGAFFMKRLGLLYGINTLGAFVGVLGSGLVAIGEFGETKTVLAGILINFIVALLAMLLSKEQPAGSTAPALAAQAPAIAADCVISPYGSRIQKLLLWAYAANGFVAISYEIIWTRLFQIQVGTSIYAFSLMLGWYLAGIASGSLFAGKYLKGQRNFVGLFGSMQIVLGFLGVFGMYIFLLFNPDSCDTVLNPVNMLIMPLLVVFPMTFLMGMLLPIASKIYVKNEHEAGKDIGAEDGVQVPGGSPAGRDGGPAAHADLHEDLADRAQENGDADQSISDEHARFPPSLSECRAA